MLIVKPWIAPLCYRKDLWENAWVKWVHHSDGIIHCIECLQLDGCFFLFVNAPACPQHEKCHCTLEAIDYSVVQRKAAASSIFKKFDQYLFNTNGLYFHGKEKLFLEWGYTADDAKWLQDEMERQARLSYISEITDWVSLTYLVNELTLPSKFPEKKGLELLHS